MQVLGSVARAKLISALISLLVIEEGLLRVQHFTSPSALLITLTQHCVVVICHIALLLLIEVFKVNFAAS